jgi:hypothetical protein
LKRSSSKSSFLRKRALDVTASGAFLFGFELREAPEPVAKVGYFCNSSATIGCLQFFANEL